MPPVNVSATQKESFTFLSFLQCNRHSKSGSHDSGISTADRNKTVRDDDVIIISDDSNSEPEFEMLCEVEFDGTGALPMPIEQKPICKTEPESTQETSVKNTADHHSDSEHSLLQFFKEEPDSTLNLGECDEELLPLCKAEYGDSTLNNNYILFMCPQCGTSFDSSSTWKKHIDKAHNLSDQRTFNFTQRPNNKFQCNKCHAIITRCTLKTLQQHHFTHLPFKVYKCKLCRHEERSLYLMISHIMLHKDKEEVVALGMQSSSVTSIDSVLKHECKQFIAYICPVCGVSFDCEDTWQAHINFKHNFLEKTAENRFDDHFKCTDCSVEIFSQHVGDLQKHLFTHLPFKSFLKCKICNWTISRHNFMISHILNLHKSHLSHAVSDAAAAPTAANIEKMSTSLPCVFNYDDDDDDEEIIISDIVPPSQKTSVSMSAVSERVASRPRRKKGFMCVRCGRHFPTAERRNAHNVAEHGKYVCTECNQNFAVKADMKRHNCLRDTKVLQCTACRKIYNYEKCYQNHMRRCRKSN